MRDRLIELLEAVYKNPKVRCPRSDELTCEGCKYDLGNQCDISAIIADYLLANGVIVPPCKSGDRACHLTSIDTLDELNVEEIFEGKVSSISIEDKVWIFCRYDNGLNFWYTESDIGKSLFLTREEAEAALAERSCNGSDSVH